MRLSLRKQNSGASLLAVVIALAFVMTIGGIVLNLTLTNIQMREAELSGKKNFYSAEEVLDEIAAACNDAASQAMVKAYTDVLADYKNIVSVADEENTAFDVFKKAYMYELQEIFYDPYGPKQEKRIKYDEFDAGEVIYVWGYYDRNRMLSLLADTRNVTLDQLKADKICTEYLRIWLGSDDDTEAPEENVAETTFTADYLDGIFTIQNIRVDYTDERGYETTIITDMIFTTPSLNFDGTNKVMNYMKYALIADDSIQVNSVTVNVNGSIYAGTGGIVFNHSNNSTFKGANIVTRGDIDIQPGSMNVTIGDSASRIWAENIVTSYVVDPSNPGAQDGDPSSVTIEGNCYVADDLTLSGNQSTVKLLGSYYGYNFRENYTGAAVNDKAEFSSAIIINGKRSRLDLSGLNYLMLAGKTFIAKHGTFNSDISLGESLSVRTNQLAYYVPDSMLNTGNKAEPGIDDEDQFETEYKERFGVDNVLSYLDETTPIATYQYRDNGQPAYRYYLNFPAGIEGEQKANSFFKEYWEQNRARLSSYADGYADAIILDDNTLLSLKGDLLYKNGEGFQTKETVLNADNWTVEGVYYTYADMLAVNYMALQGWLEDSHVGVNSNRVRFYVNDTNIGEIDKSIQPLFDNLVDRELFEIHPEDGYKKSNPVEGSDPDPVTELIIVKDNASSESGVLKVEGNNRGIVIVTGDVYVSGKFSGMILAGGNITFADGAEITSNELLVSQMFAEDLESELGSEFAQYFYGFNNTVEEVIGTVQIDKYLHYGNWTRTVK